MTAPAVLLEWSPSAPARASRRRTRHWVFIVAGTLVLSILAVPLAAMFSVLRWAKVDDRTHTDAIVVLGTAQYQGVPSPVLANRLAHAKELLSDGAADHIITVGGFRFGDISSEAVVGKEELVAEGLRRDQVIAIPFGTDTRDSLEAVATVAAEQGIHSITLVSDPAHMARSRSIAKSLGLDAHVSPTQHGPGTQMPSQYIVRESVGLLDLWSE